MSELSVYQFRDPRDFLREIYEQKRTRNPGFSVRSWARQMGLPHHAMLALTLQKKRKLKPPFSVRLRDQIGLAGQEARYFDLLVAYSAVETTEEKQFYEGLLREVSPQGQAFAELSFDILRLVSQWAHSAVIEMTELEDFDSDPRQIASRLGDHVKPAEAEQMVDRLVRLRLLERVTENGKTRLRKTHQVLRTPNDVPSPYIREFHRQMLDKAKAALDTQAVEEREMRSCSLAIRRDRLPEAKRMMREFMSRFRETVGLQPGEQAQDVYQLNLQFFALTEKSQNTGEVK